MSDAISDDPPSPLALLAIAATAVVGGAVLGALMNSTNGAVSSAYFRRVMRWDDVENVWRAALAQGIFEGLIYGVLAAIVIVIVLGKVTRARVRFIDVRARLSGMLLGILVCWAIGGTLAIGLATLSPEFYRRAFIGVPEEFGAMLRYAWVGGSIWGAMFGALLNLAVGCILIAADWRRRSVS